MRLPYPIRRLSGTVLRGVPVTVREGPNAGRRWSLASAGRGIRQGRFEQERLEALGALVRPGEHVWDLGAHKGYVTLALSRLVGPDGSVSAVEPSSQNLWFLHRHLAWNAPGNVRVIEAAVADRNGTERFGGRGSTIQFHLGEGDEEVRVATLPSLLETDGLPRPSVIKMDIEGAEGAALAAADDLLHAGLLLFVSTHSREQAHRCSSLLEERGFHVRPSKALATLLDRPDAPWAEDPELVAFGPERDVSEQDLAGLALFGDPS